MSSSVLILTFSPVQSFISEARRTADLHSGSRILVSMARSAARVLGNKGTMVYPASLGGDTPNKLVCLVPSKSAAQVAREAHQALIAEWQRIADMSAEAFRACTNGFMPPPDETWKTIWQRQISNCWDVFWAAASIEGRTYAEAYLEAGTILDAVKRLRPFEQVLEPGSKDSLCGMREALHTRFCGAREYWSSVSQALGPARVRPGGREQLDALGLIKRFGPFSQGPSFPSTSSVASLDVLAKARPRLGEYRRAVEMLLRSALFRVTSDIDWPYDGDLFYFDTLTLNRLSDSYGVPSLDPLTLRQAQDSLRSLYDQVGHRPSRYYAVVVLDGDNIGRLLSGLTSNADPRAYHREFSTRLSRFSDHVRNSVTQDRGAVVYNGGDDLLLLAPLAYALPLAQALADAFADIVGCTASAGLAIVHHLYPLDAAIRAARDAERRAKDIPGKSAVGIHVLRRSGQLNWILSPWSGVREVFTDFVRLLSRVENGQALASAFTKDVSRVAHAFAEPSESFRAELQRLLTRHVRRPGAADPAAWAERLTEWAAVLSRAVIAPAGPELLARWLSFALFLARGGDEP